jgi:hypothetical protein
MIALILVLVNQKKILESFIENSSGEITSILDAQVGIVAVEVIACLLSVIFSFLGLI